MEDLGTGKNRCAQEEDVIPQGEDLGSDLGSIDSESVLGCRLGVV